MGALQLAIHLLQRGDEAVLELRPLIVVPVLTDAAAQACLLELFRTCGALGLDPRDGLLHQAEPILHSLAVRTQLGGDFVQPLLVVAAHAVVGSLRRLALLGLQTTQPVLILLAVLEKLVYLSRYIIRHLAHLGRP